MPGKKSGSSASRSPCASAKIARSAEDLTELVEVDYDELPAIVSCDGGRKADAVQLHESWGDNLFLETSFDSGIGAIAATAPVVVELEVSCARQTMHPLEGKGVLAHWDYRAGQLVVYTSTQVPHLIRAGLAECLGLPQAVIRVIAPDVGGGFGYKCLLQPEEIAVAWLALTYKTPFRWTEDRREHLVAGANARQHHYKIKAYADTRGKLLGLDAEVSVDTGAYSVWPFTACLEAAQAGGNLPGPYHLTAYRAKIFSVATNKPPFAPYRGVARPGVCFAMEQTIDAIAKAVGREAWEVRAENLVAASAMPYTNITNKHYDSGDYPGALLEAKEMIGLDAFRAGPRRDARGRYLGVGFASYTEQSAHGTKVFAAWGLPLVPGFDQAFVKLTPDGALEVRSGIHTIGQGLETTLAQIAGEVTGVPYKDIRVTLGDTGTTPFSTGAYASRGIVMTGGAVARAAEVVAFASRLSPRICCRSNRPPWRSGTAEFMWGRPACRMKTSAAPGIFVRINCRTMSIAGDWRRPRVTSRKWMAAFFPTPATRFVSRSTRKRALSKSSITPSSRIAEKWSIR